MSVDQAIKDAINIYLGHHDHTRNGELEVANSVLSKLSRQELEEFYRPVMFRRVSVIWRNMTRKSEELVYEDVARGVDFTEAISVRLGKHCFKLPSGEIIAWGRATNKQHELRASRVNSVRTTSNNTLKRVADLHLRCAAEIVANGVTCLDDLSPSRREELEREIVEANENMNKVTSEAKEIGVEMIR